MNAYTRDIITQTLDILKRENQRSDKIMLHKFLFFLEFMGLPTGMRFEPYTYGPFSFDLANNLYSMSLLGEIDLNKENYYNKTPAAPSRLSKKIDKLFSRFSQIIKTFNFGDLECVGTLLYCDLALRRSGIQKPSRDDILQEFKKWKGSKYPDKFVKKYLSRLSKRNILKFC